GRDDSKDRIFLPVAQISQSIRRILTSCLPPRGISGVKAGSTAPAAKVLPRLRPVDCFGPQTGAILGLRSRLRPINVSLRNRMGASRLRSRLQTPNAFMLLSNHQTERFSFPMTAA